MLLQLSPATNWLAAEIIYASFRYTQASTDISAQVDYSCHLVHIHASTEDYLPAMAYGLYGAAWVDYSN